MIVSPYHWNEVIVFRARYERLDPILPPSERAGNRRVCLPVTDGERKRGLELPTAFAHPLTHSPTLYASLVCFLLGRSFPSRAIRDCVRI